MVYYKVALARNYFFVTCVTEVQNKIFAGTGINAADMSYEPVQLILNLFQYEMQIYKTCLTAPWDQKATGCMAFMKYGIATVWHSCSITHCMGL